MNQVALEYQKILFKVEILKEKEKIRNKLRRKIRKNNSKKTGMSERSSNLRKILKNKFLKLKKDPQKQKNKLQLGLKLWINLQNLKQKRFKNIMYLRPILKYLKNKLKRKLK
jgi:hypothetical protein